MTMQGPEVQPHPSHTILCVDDLSDNLVVRKIMLQTFGYRVLTAQTPTEALEILRTEDVHLILLDYNFPGHETGEWLAHQVKAQWPHIRTIMLSGFPEVPAEAQRSVDRFFIKGGNPKDLRKELESLLPPSANDKLRTPVQSENLELRKRAAELKLEARRLKRTG